MGCDIHLYVEYKPTDSSYYQSFSGQIDIGRNYMMFGLMADGVRGSYAGSIKPKGLPEGVSWQVDSDNRLYISESSNDEGLCTLDKAKEYEKCDNSIIKYTDGKPTSVTHPDWHSHSWLSIAEIEFVIHKYELLCIERCQSNGLSYGVNPIYKVILSLMKNIDEYSSDVRIVFWFDN